MKRNDASSLILDLAGLGLYGRLRADPVLAAAAAFLEELREHEAPTARPGGAGAAACAAAAAGDSGSADRLRDALAAWGGFARELAGALWGADGESGTGTWAGYVARLAATDENPFTLSAESAGADGLPPPIAAAARADLDRLRRIAAWDLRDAAEGLAESLEQAGYGGAAASLRSEAAGLVRPAQAMEGAGFDAAALAERIRTRGAGLLGSHRAFLWTGSAGGAPLRPIRCPDPIALEDLSGYQEQRAVVVSNTVRFLEGRGANNLLLYGDRGTGKSATVKAACNAYAERGLRLVEVRKADLPFFSDILETLSARPLRFVVFIDDLSFEETDDAFTGLKALLEGGAERRPDNVVVYATSNRRHLVKERFEDRPTTAMAAMAAETGDVRAFDSMQEQLSLADRFGVTVVFSAPGQDEYLRIAEFLAEREGLLKGTEGEDRRLFRENALRWERWFNGRSPRTARQFVDWMAGGAGFPWE